MFSKFIVGKSKNYAQG